MRVAFICSAHGFGHVARQMAVAQELRARGAAVSFFTAAPAALVHADLPDATVVPWTVDVGIVQRDSLSEDENATVAAVAERCSEKRIDALASALSGFDRVVVDIAPAGLEAARRAGHAPIAVGNFDWAWIYRHYPVLRPWSDRFTAWQAPHVALALAPGPGLHGFASVERMGIVGRRRNPVSVPIDGPDAVGARSVLVSFGGFGLDGVEALLPRISGVIWVLAPPMARSERPDCVWAPCVSFPALVASVDAVLTKPGYGIHVESVLAGTPVVWLDRGAFPEAPYLEAAMRARGDEKVSSRSGRVTAQDVRTAVLSVLCRPRPAPVESDGAARVADRVLR